MKWKIRLFLNVKAMNLLYNVLDIYESSRIKGCKLTKKIWDKLYEMHKGS